jgi:hypothetical protein
MRYPKILKKIKANNSLRVSSVWAFFVVWPPAFGLLPENSLVVSVMKAGFLIVLLLWLTFWFLDSLYIKIRAIAYVGVFVISLFWSVLIYYTRIIEHFYSTFYQPVPTVLLNTMLFTIISVRWFIEIYRSHQVRLRELRRRGLLRRYKILDEEQGIFRLTRELPGLDGSSPDKEMEKQFARWRWLDALPIGGITFFLLRTVSGSIGWLMLLACVGMYAMLFPLFARMMALWMELWEWEWDLEKKIYIAEKEKKTQ